MDINRCFHAWRATGNDTAARFSVLLRLFPRTVRALFSRHPHARVHPHALSRPSGLVPRPTPFLCAILCLGLLGGCSSPGGPYKMGKRGFSRPSYAVQSPNVTSESLSTPRIPGTPEETTLLHGQRLVSQGQLLDGWRQWATLMTHATNDVADEAWQFMVTSYLENGNVTNTPRFLVEFMPPELTEVQVRRLHQLTRLHAKPRLQHILALQPASSRLVPFLQLALADRLIQAEQVSGARLLWQHAKTSPLTSAEAERRLSRAPTQPPFRVGLLVPMSAQWTRMGTHLLHAAQKAVADYPDVPLQLVIADSGDSAATSRHAMNTLIAQQVHVVIGPVLHATVQPAVEIAVDHGIPIVTMNPNTNVAQSSQGVFVNAFHPTRQADLMAQHAVLEKQHRRIAIIAPESEYGKNMSDAFTKQVGSLGGTIVHTAYYPPDTLDFSAFLKPLVSLRSGGVPIDAIFLPTSAEQARLIAPQAAFFGIGAPRVALLGTALWNNPKLLTEGTDYLRGAVFCDTNVSEKEWFNNIFQQSWRQQPSALAALTYDGVAIVAQLLRDQRIGDHAWYDGLRRTVAFYGSNGPVRFLTNGKSMRNYHFLSIKDGQIRFLKKATRPHATPFMTQVL